MACSPVAAVTRQKWPVSSVAVTVQVSPVWSQVALMPACHITLMAVSMSLV